MSKRITKPSISSKSTRKRINTGLGWGQRNKNINSLRKIEQVIQEEEVLKINQK